MPVHLKAPPSGTVLKPARQPGSPAARSSQQLDRAAAVSSASSSPKSYQCLHLKPSQTRRWSPSPQRHRFDPPGLVRVGGARSPAAWEKPAANVNKPHSALDQLIPAAAFHAELSEPRSSVHSHRWRPQTLLEQRRCIITGGQPQPANAQSTTTRGEQLVKEHSIVIGGNWGAKEQSATRDESNSNRAGVETKCAQRTDSEDRDNRRGSPIGAVSIGDLATYDFASARPSEELWVKGASGNVWFREEVQKHEQPVEEPVKETEEAPIYDRSRLAEQYNTAHSARKPCCTAVFALHRFTSRLVRPADHLLAHDLHFEAASGSEERSDAAGGSGWFKGDVQKVSTERSHAAGGDGWFKGDVQKASKERSDAAGVGRWFKGDVHKKASKNDADAVTSNSTKLEASTQDSSNMLTKKSSHVPNWFKGTADSSQPNNTPADTKHRDPANGGGWFSSSHQSDDTHIGNIVTDPAKSASDVVEAIKQEQIREKSWVQRQIQKRLEEPEWANDREMNHGWFTSSKQAVPICTPAPRADVDTFNQGSWFGKKPKSEAEDPSEEPTNAVEVHLPGMLEIMNVLRAVDISDHAMLVGSVQQALDWLFAQKPAESGLWDRALSKDEQVFWARSAEAASWVTVAATIGEMLGALPDGIINRTVCDHITDKWTHGTVDIAKLQELLVGGLSDTQLTLLDALMQHWKDIIGSENSVDCQRSLGAVASSLVFADVTESGILINRSRDMLLMEALHKMLDAQELNLMQNVLSRGVNQQQDDMLEAVPEAHQAFKIRTLPKKTHASVVIAKLGDSQVCEQAAELLAMLPLQVKTDLKPDVTVLQVASVMNLGGLECIPAAEMDIFAKAVRQGQAASLDDYVFPNILEDLVVREYFDLLIKIRDRFESLRSLFALREHEIIVIPELGDLAEFGINLGQFKLIRDRILSKNPSAIASVLPIPADHVIGNSFIYTSPPSPNSQVLNAVELFSQVQHGDVWLELDEKLEQLFVIMDTNGDGSLTEEDVERACGRPNLMMMLAQMKRDKNSYGITKAQMMSFFHNQVVEQYGQKASLKLVSQLCQEESNPGTFDNSATDDMINVQREATGLFTRIDANSDSVLTMAELGSVWTPSGSILDIEVLHDAEQGPLVVKQELAKLKSALPLESTIGSSIKPKTKKTSRKPVAQTQNAALRKLALKVFKMVDTDGSGEISKIELFQSESAQDDQSTLVSMWKNLDQSGDGLISTDEWMEYWSRLELETNAHAAEAQLVTMRQHLKLHMINEIRTNATTVNHKLRAVFDLCDVTCCGVAVSPHPTEAFAALTKMDIDKDGKVSFEEFSNYWASLDLEHSCIDNPEDGLTNLERIVSPEKGCRKSGLSYEEMKKEKLISKVFGLCETLGSGFIQLEEDYGGTSWEIMALLAADIAVDTVVAFKQMDSNKDFTISFDQFRSKEWNESLKLLIALKTALVSTKRGVSQSTVEDDHQALVHKQSELATAAFTALDVNKSGTTLIARPEDSLITFSQIDEDDDGHITESEFRKYYMAMDPSLAVSTLRTMQQWLQ